MTTPETRYAKSGDLSIAYQVVGDGPIDIVFVQGFVSHVELAWETPTFAGILNRLATFSRLILFDKRGTGLSDRTARMPTLEERMDDMRAVMDAAGSERAALIGISEGGPMSLLFSATYPERTLALVLWATFARNLWAPDYPIGIDAERAARGYGFIQAKWGQGRVLRRVSMQDAPDDPVVQQLLARYERNSATPAAAVEALRFGVESDVRHILPAICVPTLVVHHSGDPLVPVELGAVSRGAHPGGADGGVSRRLPPQRGRRRRRAPRRGRGVPLPRPAPAPGGAGSEDRAVHGHRRLDGAGGAARRPVVAGVARRARRHGAPRGGALPAAAW